MWRQVTTELRELIHIKLIASIINEINAAFNSINKTMNLGRVNAGDVWIIGFKSVCGTRSLQN